MLLDSIQNGLQQVVDRFSHVCCVSSMKISTTKAETICHTRQPKQCFLQVGGVSVKLSKKFKYLEVSFTRDGRQNRELDPHRKSKCSSAPAPPICGTEMVALQLGKAVHF